MKQNIGKKILLDIINAHPKTYSQFLILKKKYSGQAGLAPVTNATLISAYSQLKPKDLPKNIKTYQLSNLLTYLTKRPTRTLSGVTPLTVLTKPYPCPGQCIYCPNEPGMPKSYLSNEPAAQRAKLNNFDPIKQVKMRIRALEANGHVVDKIELLILGGCFNAYPKSYQKNFIKKCFDACNTYQSSAEKWRINSPLPVSGKKHNLGSRGFNLGKATSIDIAFKKNETAKYRIIGITIETRPDLINEKEIKWFRQLGVTRVQLGVQHLDDQILKLVKRGHTAKQTIEATKLLKQAGFKIDYHLMPDLPGSTPAKDLKMFKQLFTDENFQPDQIKIYPTVVNEYAPLYKWYQSGKHQPYSQPKAGPRLPAFVLWLKPKAGTAPLAETNQLINLLTKIKQLVPYYVRINRLIRDIPKESIIAGNKITNLREFIKQRLNEQGKICKCIRCREAKGDITDLKKAKLFIEKYRASDGWEYFISYESLKRDKLYSFVRLRLNDDKNNFLTELKDAVLVRELHTYGQLVPTNDPASRGFTPRPESGSRDPQSRQAIQHTGFGKRLMKIAEDMAEKQGYKKIAVIAGIGVRPYYKKLGYRLESTYMIKYLH